MKVLDLPDNQDNPIRQILLKQDDDTLDELVKKSKQEIQTFLIKAKETQTVNIKKEEYNKQNIETQKNNEKLNRLISAFPKSVLDKNPNISKMLDDKDFDGLLGFLKS